MKIFLTGGTGFIGIQLTKSLRARGWQVTALVRNPKSLQAQTLSAIGVQLAIGDATDRESMREPMTEADVVIHNCGHYEFGVNAAGRERMQAVNVQGTDNVLGLALELGIPRTVYISTAFAFGDSGPQLQDETFARSAPYGSYYEQTKTEAHQIALSYQERGLPLIIACPNGVAGVNDHSHTGYFLRLYLNKLKPPMAWTPNATYSFVDVHDLAEGISLAVEKGCLGETYLFCGESTSLRELFEIWEKKPGSFKTLFWLPPGLMAFLVWPLEPLLRAAGLPAFLSRETVRATSGNLNYSGEKARRELGWSHKTAEEMWFGIIDKELKLLAKQRDGNLISRLKPNAQSVLA